MKPIRIVPFLATLFALLAACNYPTATLPSTAEIVTAVVGTLTAEASSVPTQTPLPPLLPHSLFFLSERSGSTQVWQLGRDGVTLSQVTDEPNGVDDFDVTRTHGTLAYVTNNQLVLIGVDGNRKIVIDNSQADAEAPDYYYNHLLKTPRFSSDGKTLAYALDGIYFYSIDSGETQQVISNELETSDDGVVSAKELYYPLAWSPDGTKLLINIAFGEGSQLAILPNENPNELLRLQANGSFCCEAAWAPDNGSLLVASPYTGLVESGLWRYDANTGGEAELVSGYSDSVYNFVGWPLQIADGSLRYFYNSSTELPQGDQAFFIMSSQWDGVTDRLQLRPEPFNIIDALWAEDGSLVLLVQPGPAGSGNSGPVALVYADGRPVVGLVDQARELRWGP
ncbi:MAG TPA: hypothetical protein VLK33_09110 [Terriglobales bacterium]|nr:hypothetical protein [Terriglobales bacterium]